MRVVHGIRRVEDERKHEEAQTWFKKDVGGKGRMRDGEKKEQWLRSMDGLILWMELNRSVKTSILRQNGRSRDCEAANLFVAHVHRDPHSRERCKLFPPLCPAHAFLHFYWYKWLQMSYHTCFADLITAMLEKLIMFVP